MNSVGLCLSPAPANPPAPSCTPPPQCDHTDRQTDTQHTDTRHNPSKNNTFLLYSGARARDTRVSPQQPTVVLAPTLQAHGKATLLAYLLFSACSHKEVLTKNAYTSSITYLFLTNTSFL